MGNKSSNGQMTNQDLIQSNNLFQTDLRPITCQCELCKYFASANLAPAHRANDIGNNFSFPNNTRQRRTAVINNNDDNKYDIDDNQPSVNDFEVSALLIESNNISLSIFTRLKSMTSNLLKDDVKYQTLHVDQPLFMETCLGWKGVLPFLELLGFKINNDQNKFVCLNKPPIYTIKNAIDVLQFHIKKLQKKSKPVINEIIDIASEDDEKQIILKDKKTDNGNIINKSNNNIDIGYDQDEFIMNRSVDIATIDGSNSAMHANAITNAYYIDYKSID